MVFLVGLTTPHCPNPGDVGELTRLLTQWGYTYESVTSGAVDVAYQHNVTTLWKHLLTEFPKLGFWPLYHTMFYWDFAEPTIGSVGDAADFFTQNTLTTVADNIENYWDDQNFFTPEMFPYWDECADFHSYHAPNIHGCQVEVPADEGFFEEGLLIVPVHRPADIPAVVGWHGTGCSGAEASTMLRSWEDRFGTVLTHLEWDAMTLQLGDCGTLTEKQRLQLTLEHYRFCPNNFYRCGRTFLQYSHLLEQREWAFYWDKSVYDG